MTDAATIHCSSSASSETSSYNRIYYEVQEHPAVDKTNVHEIVPRFIQPCTTTTRLTSLKGVSKIYDFHDLTFYQITSGLSSRSARFDLS
eukprot:6212992-Pleurochrysis_carterae.AAC.3